MDYQQTSNATQKEQPKRSVSLQRLPSFDHAPTYPLLELQHTIGNQAVLNLLRSRNIPGDASTQAPIEPHADHDFRQTPIRPIQTTVTRTEPKVDHMEPTAAGLPLVDDVIRSSGVPLDPTVRTSAEAYLGFDFARVRVHADETAARSANAIRARAYTVGSHIAFARGKYQPRTPEGARLVLHELIHVAQQGPAADTAPTPGSMTQPHDANEREAQDLVNRCGAGGAPLPIVNKLGPVVARFDATAAELQEERSAALRQGRNPDEPVIKPLDALERELREVTRNPQPKAPEPTLPGDPIQQAHTVPTIDPDDLWFLPRIQDRIKTIAAETETREREAMKSGGKIEHTAANMLNYWRQRFDDSVYYILYVRPFKGGSPRRAWYLKELRVAEEKLVKSAPADLVAQVEILRLTLKDKWQQEVERAADQFVTLVSNEAQFLTVKQAATPVQIYGLPEWLEGTVKASEYPGIVEQDKDSPGFAPSVIEFMKAAQKESGLKVLAENYARHEQYNPYIGDIEGIGKYSFDVHLDGLINKNADGFYEREAMIKFFLAVDRAADATGTAWVALYNDFEVAKRVNEALGKRRVGFSGGGSAGLGKEGSIHHGPEPYLLHVHFNIMPIDIAGQYFAGKAATPPYIDLGHWQ